MSHILIKTFFDLICYTLLWAIDVSGTVFSAERIIYITCDLNVTVGKLWIHVVCADGCHFCESLSTLADIVAMFVKEVISESHQHSDAAVICGAAADAYDKVTAAFFDGIVDHFSDSISSCKKRILFFFSQQCNSRCRCHLHHSSPGV